MLRIEDECVGPCPQGCLGSSCPYRHVHRYYCDQCGEEVHPEELYEYDDEQLCAHCLLGKFDTVA